jgi:uncharacterized protein with PQ loop repeat
MIQKDIAEGFAYAGMTLSASASLPQIWRLLRSGGNDGVSAVSWALTACGYGLWATYGLLLPILPQVPGNLFSFCSVIILLSIMARNGLNGLLPAALLGLGAMVGLAVFSTTGAVGVGWLAFATSVSRGFPQLKRTLSAQAPTEFSRAAWGLNGIGAAAWLTYAILDRDFPVLGSASVSVIISLVIVTVATVRLRVAEARSCPVPV